MLILTGFKFGLLLQLAVGPICLMTFNLALAEGFFKGAVFAAAITLVDALYISLACIGLSKIIKKNKMLIWLNYAGRLILIILGITMLMNVNTAVTNSPISYFSPLDAPYKIFAQGLLLTATNPLTIIFWGGIFSLQIAERNLSSIQLRLFAAGCILSSAFFLIGVALLGSFAAPFLSPTVINILNAIVGCFIIYCGLRSFL